MHGKFKKPKIPNFNVLNNPIKAHSEYKTFSSEALLKPYNLVKDSSNAQCPSTNVRDRVLGKTEQIHSRHETFFTKK